MDKILGAHSHLRLFLKITTAIMVSKYSQMYQQFYVSIIFLVIFIPTSHEIREVAIGERTGSPRGIY
jgi:hypothetical protein